MPLRTYIIDSDGYFRFEDNRMLVHRFLVEKNIGRHLKSEEVVHHIDGNKLNNDLSNLQICKNQFEHAKIHANEQGYKLTISGSVMIYEKILL